MRRTRSVSRAVARLESSGWLGASGRRLVGGAQSLLVTDSW